METTAEIKAAATEAADPVTAARHELEAAFRAFRKRAGEVNYRALTLAARFYQDAQYNAETARVTAEYRKGGD